MAERPVSSAGAPPIRSGAAAKDLRKTACNAGMSEVSVRTGFEKSLIIAPVDRVSGAPQLPASPSGRSTGGWRRHGWDGSKSTAGEWRATVRWRKRPPGRLGLPPVGCVMLGAWLPNL